MFPGVGATVVAVAIEALAMKKSAQAAEVIAAVVIAAVAMKKANKLKMKKISAFPPLLLSLINLPRNGQIVGGYRSIIEISRLGCLLIVYSQLEIIIALALFLFGSEI